MEYSYYWGFLGDPLSTTIVGFLAAIVAIVIWAVFLKRGRRGVLRGFLFAEAALAALAIIGERGVIHLLDTEYPVVNLLVIPTIFALALAISASAKNFPPLSFDPRD